MADENNDGINQRRLRRRMQGTNYADLHEGPLRNIEAILSPDQRAPSGGSSSSSISGNSQPGQNEEEANKAEADVADAENNDGNQSSGAGADEAGADTVDELSVEAGDDALPDPQDRRRRPPMTAAEARAYVKTILDENGLGYMLYINPGQFVTLALKVISNNPHRDQALQDEINLYHEENENRLHDVELNELACKLDWFVKLKANIVGAIDLLQRTDEKGRRLAKGMESADDEYLSNDESEWVALDGEVPSPRRHDVFLWVPAKMAYEMCQGQAKRIFGKPAM